MPGDKVYIILASPVLCHFHSGVTCGCRLVIVMRYCFTITHGFARKTTIRSTLCFQKKLDPSNIM